jgi:predicted enzyme related to lactoylglutathione lyase
MAVGVRRPGEFCWINVLSPEPAKACDFFAKVLGWTYFDMSGMGFGIKANGKDIGGLFDLHGPHTPPGTPPVIGVLIKVANADQTVERVRTLGGKANPAFDVLDNGRLAVCFDPNGAQFDVWQSKRASMTEADTSWHGVPSWSETITSDVSRAKEFYRELFDWTAESMPMLDFEYTVFSLGQDRVAGMMPIQPEMGNVPPHWGTYFTVKDVDETVKIAKAAGGTIHIEPMDIPSVGRFAMIVSPQGVNFYVITYLPRPA